MIKRTKFFLNIVKHDLERMRRELQLREYDNKIYNAEDKEYFINKDEADIKKSYEILNRNLQNALSPELRKKIQGA